MAFKKSAVTAAVMLAAALAGAQQAGPSDLASIQKSFKADAAGITPFYVISDDGFVSGAVAPSGARFDTGTQLKSTDAAATARAFLMEHRAALGLKAQRSDLVVDSVVGSGANRSVKFNQMYDGVPVYGAKVSVSLTDGLDVRGLLSDIMRDSGRLDRESAAVTPTKTTAEAKAAALSAVKATTGLGTLKSSEPELVVYDPRVVGEIGTPHLAYRTVVSGNPGSAVAEEVLVDAHNNSVLLRYSLVCMARNRVIYDLQDDLLGVGTQVRAEGDPPVDNFDEANDVYDFLGDTYDFYALHHGRDSQNGMGNTLKAFIRDPGTQQNAYYFRDFVLGPITVYGPGISVDDIVGHEVTHGVTDFTSGLNYINESGAINESMSDIWGEAIDLTNGSDDDVTENRWKIGEGSAFFSGDNGVIRNMANPLEYGQPDRYGLYARVSYDQGGVHINSGIGNKLFYLLVKGGTFNDFVITPTNMYKVLDVYYEAQTQHLVPSSEYTDLFAALYMSAINQGWTDSEVANLINAGAAVEIIEQAPGLPLRGLRAQSLPSSNNVIVTWDNPTSSAFSGATLIRNLSRFPNNNSDGTVIDVGTNNFYVDSALAPGQHVYYKLVARFGSSGIAYAPQFRFVHEQSRAPSEVDYLSEEFGTLSDLSFTQLTYAPTGDWTNIYNSNKPQEYGSHRFYSVAVKKNVSALPVLRLNANSLPMPEDKAINIPESILGGEIPFFGRLMTSILVSPNGFVAPGDSDVATPLAQISSYNLPSYESHFSTPRISAVFADLSPPSGGDVWVRRLTDRFVITFENVPQYNVFPKLLSTFQIELFYSGHIRVTYLDVQARGSVAGLSDGRGIPQEPTELPSPFATVLMSDLSNSPSSNAFNLQPIGIQTVDELETIAFTVGIDGATGGTASVTADNLPVGATFNPVTREFFWQTVKGDSGIYVVKFRGLSGSDVAYQNAYLIVRAVGSVPVVTDVTIVPEEPTEDGTLTVVYAYDEPNGISEGSSDIYWYRNGAYVNGLVNQRGVPAEALQVGDVWYVAVTPRTAFGTVGAAVWSEPVVIAAPSKADINSDNKIEAADIQMVINAVLGISVGVFDADANLDGSVDSADIQLVINKVLK